MRLVEDAMRIGNIPENIYNRSIKRVVNKYNKDFTEGTAARRDCAFLCAEGYQFGDAKQLWRSEAALCMQELLAKAIAVAGRPVSVQAKITIPEAMDEPELRELINALVSVIGDNKLYIDELSAKTVLNISYPMVTYILLGEKTDIGDIPQNATNIIMTGFAGCSGATYLANRFEEKLLTRYSGEYVRRMQRQFDGIMKIDEIIAILMKNSSHAYEVGEGGLFGALWKLGADIQSGLEVDLKAIPIYQETVEVCDFLDINPYMLYSGGCLLLLTDKGEELMDDLSQIGMNASYIGKLTDKNDRVIQNKEETRYLTMPEQDEIFRALI